MPKNVLQYCILFCCLIWGTSSSHAQIFTEDFESGATGWIVFENGAGITSDWVLSDIDPFAGTFSAYVEYEAVGGANAEDWLVTPQITPTSTDNILSFFQQQSFTVDWGTTYTIRVSTASQNNPADFVIVDTQTESDFGLSYTLHTVDLSAYIGTPIYIAFVMEQDDGDNWFIDDVEVGPFPCTPPDNLSAANITQTTADISWSDYNGSTSWEVEIVFENEVPTGVGSVIGFNPAAVSNLEPGTSYDFYVRDLCAGGSSAWSGPYTFSTVCPTIFTAPYTQNFNSDILAPCWSESGSEPWNFSTFAAYGASTAGDHTGNGGNYAWIDGSSPSGVGQISTLTSPRVDISTLTSPALYYWIYSNNIDNTSFNTLTVEFYDGAAWNTIQTLQDNLDTSWVEFVFNLDNFTVTGPVQVRFTVEENSPSSSFFHDILVDDVEFKDGPSCFDPYNLAVTATTASTADLSWTVGDINSTSWEIEIIPSGTSPTGAGTVVTSNPYTATGLMMATSYDYYVREICGPGDFSNWIGPVSFTTDCGIFMAPYIEQFDSLFIPICWTESGVNPWSFNTLADYAATSAGDHTGNGGYYAWMDGSSNTNGDQSTLTSPPVDISPLSNPTLRYWLFSDNTDDNTFNTLEVEFYDGTSWNLVQTLQGSLGRDWFEVVINLNNFTVTGPVQVRFTVEGSTSFNTFYNDILVDDVEFYDGPSCFAPSTLNALNITTTTADLSWIAGDLSSTSWELELVETSTGLSSTGTVISTNPFAATGLQPGTSYTFSVREICGVGDTSSWSPPFTFVTNCPVPLDGDLFVNPIEVTSLVYVDSGSTVNCYTNTGGNGAADVWYQLILDDCTDSVYVSLCNSDFDTYLRFFDTDSTQLLFNDDACNGTRSQLSLGGLTGGDTLLIMVEGFGLGTGEYDILIEQHFNGLPGDDLATALVIPSLPYITTSTTNDCYTDVVGEASKDVWYQLVIDTCISSIDVSLCTSTFDTYLRILDETGTEVASNDNACGLQSQILGYPVVSDDTLYIVVEGAGTAVGTYTLEIDFDTLSADFSYTTTDFCVGNTNPIATVTGTVGGVFSSSSANIVFANTTTGEIDLGASVAGGPYQITYTYTDGICLVEDSTAINIIDVSANISYNSTNYCTGASNPTASITGQTGGTFSSTAGLVLNASTGEIDLSTSTAGSYVVTYTTTSGICSNQDVFNVTINAADDASFSYSSASYCQSATNPVATVTGTLGGTFSSTAGLVLNASTGEIDLSASTVGAYTVTYTTSGVCPAVETATVSVDAADDASFSYSSASYCQSATNPVATV
ncbi:MAG: choice-of-anchor J domain-containing protein, partial [Saprospiraceae bacterium]|nr:choice-of-anchor J domain-containing protein [Saprospiraceae bacterium]